MKSRKTPMIAMLSALSLLTGTLVASASDTTGTFTFGKDDFQFINSAAAFGSQYTLTSEDALTMKEQFSNTEMRRVDAFLEHIGTWSGSCYGMAAVSHLSCYDLVPYGDYRVWDLITKQGPAESLYDFTIPGSLYAAPTDEIRSLINYYMLSQFTDNIRQHVAQQSFLTDWERIEQLMALSGQGIPATLVFWGHWFTPESQLTGHGINAVGNVEYGSFTVPALPDETFDARIQIHDNNVQPGRQQMEYHDSEGNYLYTDILYRDDQWIYVNTAEQWWYMPTVRVDSRDGASMFTIADIDLINSAGLLPGTEAYVRTEDFLAILSTDAFESDHELCHITYENGAWEAGAKVTEGIREGAPFLGASVTDSKWQYTLTDAESGYLLRMEGEEPCDLAMEYEHCMFIADAAAASEAVFHPEGYLALDGTDSAYTLEMVWNDGHYAGSWYDFTVSGTADAVSLQCTDDGYLLTSDNLGGISAFAEGDGTRSVLTFSTDAESVLLYEGEGQKLTAAIDTDGDGSYETVIAEAGTRGDVNEDGSVDAVDGAELLVAAAAVGSGAESGLTPAQEHAADVNADGAFDATDAAALLEYAAYAGSGGDLPLEGWLLEEGGL